MTGRWMLAAAAGLLLAASPFLRYAAGHGEPHADHEPRHGGQLGMAGDHHLEIVRNDGRIEVFPSDAWRRPLRARGGHLRFERSWTRALAWRDDRLVGADIAGTRDVEAVVVLADGTEVAIAFDLD